MNQIDTPEAGRLMDRIYGKQRHLYDLTRKFYLLGRDELIDALDASDGENILELACGTGRNLITAARLYPDARFFGVDVSTEMLDTAMRNIAHAGLEDRIKLAYGDARQFDSSSALGAERFDRIFISYAVSMVPEWRQLIENAVGMLEEGGSVHVVDFGQLDNLPGTFRYALFAWLRRFHVTPRADLGRTLDIVATRHGMAVQFKKLYRGYSYYGVLSQTS